MQCWADFCSKTTCLALYFSRLNASERDIMQVSVNQGKAFLRLGLADHVTGPFDSCIREAFIVLHKACHLHYHVTCCALVLMVLQTGHVSYMLPVCECSSVR